MPWFWARVHDRSTELGYLRGGFQAVYDRLVARIVLEGKDSSIELIQAGLACHFTRFVNDPLLAQAQLSARAAGRGFWAAGAAKPACVKFAAARGMRD